MDSLCAEQLFLSKNARNVPGNPTVQELFKERASRGSPEKRRRMTAKISLGQRGQISSQDDRSALRGFSGETLDVAAYDGKNFLGAERPHLPPAEAAAGTLLPGLFALYIPSPLSIREAIHHMLFAWLPLPCGHD
ncbi:MAG: hypothetical protein MPJ22_13630 [Pirellulales bacterium]|nr:hypothetical protein [Pirellulales bacterium]